MRKRVAILHEPDGALQSVLSAVLTDQGWQCETVAAVAKTSTYRPPGA